jgi:competence protein ComEA
MLKKLLLALIITAVSAFAMNFQTASKDELMSIKGIGEKRASAIMKYRRSHKIKSAADLKNIDGIGTEIADNAKRGIKNADKKVTRAKKTTKRAKSTKEKVSKKAKSTKKETTSKTSKKAKETKSKAKKRVKKKAGDATKRSEKRAKAKKAKKAAKKKVKK